MAGGENKQRRAEQNPPLVLIGRIGAAHGIRGEVRVKAYAADPSDLTRYGPLASPDGRVFEIDAMRPAAGGSPDMLVVHFAGIDTRNAAEELNGTELLVPRDRLGETGADEYFHADLIGLDAVTTAGNVLGTVIRVQNFGAGDLLEVAPRRGDTLLVPFTKAVVPEVDLANSRLVIDPPPGLLDDSGAGEQEAGNAPWASPKASAGTGPGATESKEEGTSAPPISSDASPKAGSSGSGR
jgi:16S rRNA processing protein RimM